MRPHGHTPAAPPAGAGAGLPTLKSSAEITAEANATAWKSIQKMMGQLPTFGALDQPYSAQRNAIAPLVDAHRNWLLNAGQYQTQMTNGIAQLLYGGANAGDTAAAGAAGLAGVAPGSAPPVTNVSPGAASGVATALGGSTANYLQSLLPYATAQGIGNIDRVNSNEQDAITKLGDARSQVSAQYGDLSDKAFNSLSSSYFDKYKSELAAIAAGGTAAGKTAAELEKERHNRATEGISRTNAATASSNVSKSTSAAAAKTLAGLEKADKGLVNKALGDARTTYANLGGVKATTGAAKGSGQYVVTLTLQAPKPTFGAQPKPYVTQVYGNTPEEAVHKANLKKAQQRPDTSDPANPGHWDTSKATLVSGTSSGSSGTSGVKDRPSETTRRLRAWRTFKAELQQLNSPLSTEQMQRLFRTQFGEPAK